MEYIFNHALANDTSRLSDRRVRPHSAFVPTESYYKQKGGNAEDDVGRSVLQHKPLAKGEFTQLSLAKVFQDDPGMRPRVFTQPTVNKTSYGLMSQDVEGAVPQIRQPPYKIRDTNPMQPLYVLAGTSARATAEAAATAAAAASETSSRSQTHCSLDVSDINAVPSVTERPQKLITRNTQLNTSDIQGSWPGWEPPFRAHVGKNLRDPGLDVRDISGTYSRRRVASARPTVGGRNASGVQDSTAAPPPAPAPMPAWQQTQPPPPPEGTANGASAPPPAMPPAGTPLPLRPAISAPPYATHIHGGGVAAAVPYGTQGAAEDRAAAAAAADLPSATVGRPHPGSRDPAMRHVAKRAAADVQLAAAAEAQRVMTSLNPSREAVEMFWHSCRRMDREVCGKLTPGDFAAALHHANVLTGAGGGGAAAEAAAAAALARGLQDGSGMVSYRQLAKDLLGRSPSRSASMSSAYGGAAAAAAAARPMARRPAAAAPTPSFSRQTSFGASAAAAATYSSAAAAAASPRRNVVWAAEASADTACATHVGRGGGGGGGGGGMPPQTPYHPPAYQHQQSAWPGGAGSSFTAAFQLSDSPRPLTPQTPPPQPSPSPPPPPPPPPTATAATAPPIHTALASSPSQDGSTAAAAAAAAPAAAIPAAEPMGLGPYWPPAPHQDHLQRRAATTITESSGVTLHDVVDTSFHPYKSHTYWFGGRGPAPGPEGGEPAGVGGPAEAAREYVPRDDITSFIVGKGHHRLTGPGGRLEAEAEAAVIQRHRPHSAASGNQAAARALTAGGSMRQLQLDGPQLYMHEPNPDGAAGSSLKGASAALFAASRPPPSGPRLTDHSRSRPAGVPPRGAAGAAGWGRGGGGEARVGRAASERQMLREEIAAVRGLT